MNVTVWESKILSSDSMHLLHGKVYLPDGEIKGLFHVVHGMTEHIGRYDAFMRTIAEAGYVCFGYDNLGHGYTAFNAEDLGFIAPRNGWELMAQDVVRFGEVMKVQYGNELPYILMGHSMGSFIVRLAAAKYFDRHDPDKLIVMGTGGPNSAGGIGYALAKTIRVVCGQRHVSDMLYKLAFGHYNDHFASEKDDYAWLTKDMDVRNAYRRDPFCTFRFTCSAMADLIKLNTMANKSAFYSGIAKKQLPVLLVSGTDDPVGDYGAGVNTVYKGLKQKGVNVTVKLYPGCRHEILNDSCRNEVIADILRFVDN